MSPREMPDRNDRRLWSNTRLVRECLEGRQEAWSALIDRYKNLIYSIPIKYEFSPDEATDIFQSVCLEMLSELKNLRKPEALPKWIMQAISNGNHAKSQLTIGATKTVPTRPCQPR